MRVLATFILLMVSIAAAQAQGREIVRELHFGAGLGLNDSDYGNSALGLQFFGGYQFIQKLADTFRVQVEAGYWTSGDFDANPGGEFDKDADGLWVNGVALIDLNLRWAILGRLGMDFGDADGLMVGFGADFRLNRELSLRAEFVVRDEVDSMQANIVYYLD